MLGKSKYIALICGAVSIAITILFYLLTFGNIFTIPMRWLSLMLLILAEVIATAKAFGVQRTVFGVAGMVTSIIHVIAVLIISIVFVNVFPLFITTYSLLNLLLLCVLLAADAIIFYFGHRVASHNSRMKESQSVMRCCVEKASSLCVEFHDTDYKKELEEIAELLKYADNSCLSQDEIIILNKLDEIRPLLEKKDEGISQKIIEIKNIIKLHTIKTASSKRGSY